MSRFLKRLLTQSFPGRDGAVGEGDGAAAQASAEAAIYESRAFTIWWEHFAGQDQRKLLDLGRLRPGTLAFVSARHTKLQVVGLDPASGIAGLGAVADDGTFDGALCWDLPNYLDESELTELGRWLGERLRPRAPVYLALATRVPYPDRPAAYEVLDAERLRCVPATSSGERSVLHSGPRLGRLWRGFAVERSFLLRNGMQEYVLTRGDDGER